MKALQLLLLFCFFSASLNGFQLGSRSKSDTAKDRELFQVSTNKAFSLGVFGGDYTIGNLKKRGSYGMGAFDALDGQLIALDGNFYKIDSEGEVHLAKESDVIAFAQVTFFQPTGKKKLENESSIASVMNQVIPEFMNKNVPHLIFIRGYFSWVQVGLSQKQKKPYPTLQQAKADRPMKSRQNVQGMVIGFWFPSYWAGIAQPKVQFYFLSEDLKFGGEVLHLSLLNGNVTTQALYDYQIHMPDIKDFSDAELSTISY